LTPTEGIQCITKGFQKVSESGLYRDVRSLRKYKYHPNLATELRWMMNKDLLAVLKMKKGRILGCRRLVEIELRIRLHKIEVFEDDSGKKINVLDFNCKSGAKPMKA